MNFLCGGFRLFYFEDAFEWSKTKIPARKLAGIFF
jgi:hypothetical protein